MIEFYHGLYAATAMLWETLWALVLGFSLSAVLQVFVRREQMAKHFGRANLRSMGLAAFLGAVSSSCSYAAASAAKTAFKKGSALAVALAFMFASTNLVVELSAILWLLMGWVFVLAEFVGAFVLIGVMWALLALTLPRGLEDRARQHAEPGMKSCCHNMDDDSDASGTSTPSIRRMDTWLAVANSFWMEVSMLWKEIVVGFLIAGFLMTLVPMHWWQGLFISGGRPFLRLLENAVVGPLIAVLSFVCSIGNIPLAGWLWANGISFGGVLAFIYADLIVIPLILIYRKYYGGMAAAYITLILFCSMVVSGILVDLLFNALGLVPQGPRPPSAIQDAHFQWNYTTWLNLAALCVVAWFLRLRWRQKPTVAPPT
jgi:uncharacterized membrane protein YraQ (UPF0718 family)